MIYGYDPYNSVDASTLESALVGYQGPISSVAHRCQAHWDFAPGVFLAAKLANMQRVYKMPSLARRQAE